LHTDRATTSRERISYTRVLWRLGLIKSCSTEFNYMLMKRKGNR